MTRTSPLAAITVSTMATILILSYGVQPTTSFFLPSPSSISTTSAIEGCFHRTSLASGSHIINRNMPLHSMVEENVEEKDILEAPVPTQDKNGIYNLSTKEDHLALLATHPGKIIIIKAHAPWCRTCKRLEPKFIQLSKDPKYATLPLLFAQISVQHNQAYLKSLGTVALPSVLINVGTEGLVENFPCGPRKVPILKNKISQIVKSRVDSKTLKLKVA